MAGTNIAIVTQPLPNVKGGHIVLEKFVRVLKPNSTMISVLTAFYPKSEEKCDEIRIINHPYHENSKFNYSNILEYFIFQLRLSFSLIRLYHNYDIAIFHLGAMGLIIPLFTLKLLDKKVIIVMTGSATESIKTIYRSKMGKIPFYFIYYSSYGLAHLNFILANQLIVYTKSVIPEWNLSHYSSKIQIASEHFVNFERFHIINEFTKRKKIIGFVGRLSNEKGIMNLMEAIPSILEQHPDWVFLIIGNGELENKIKEYVHNHGLKKHVEFINWVSQEQLPSYYNQLRILVLPSFTEGLPNVIIEGMACGTIVLANQVGSIPDIIKDGETGFIMENNSPESIVENMKRALSSPNLEKIADNGRLFVEENFTFESAVARWKNILD